MSGVELVRDEDSREPYHVSERPTAVAAAALERGLATRALLGGTMQLAPPLIISDEQIDRAVEILAESIIATR